MLREFKDASGTSWRVWDVYPSSGRSSQRSTPPDTTQGTDAMAVFPTRNLNDGWLCFESATEKRRLAPIPPEWETCEPCVLEDLCGRAGYITRPTPRGEPRIDP